jgi:hypothetical protein
MTKEYKDEPEHLEGIAAAQKMMLDEFGIEISNIIRTNFTEYEGTFNEQLTIYVLNNDFYFNFNDMLTLSNGVLISSVEHPFISKALSDTNALFPIFDAMRFTTEEKIVFHPILNHIRPAIVFKYNSETKQMTIYIHLLNTMNSKSKQAACVLTKDKIIQHHHEPAEFQIIYFYGSQYYISDLLAYRNRIFKAWELDEDQYDVDYKKLGELTDMINI